MAKSLGEITVPELAQVQECYLIKGFETDIMNDDEFWQFLKESIDEVDNYDYELLEDGLINIELISEHLR